MRDARGDPRGEALVARDLRIRLNAWALWRDEWSIARLEMSDARLCITWQRGSACDWRRALGAIDGVGWRHHTGTILVPTTYNRGLTGAGMQYLRLGLTGLTPDAPRQILFRRFGLSNGSSKWARSANDLRTGVHSSPSTSAAGSSAGSGDAFPFPPPPGPGGGGPTKIELIMPVE